MGMEKEVEEVAKACDEFLESHKPDVMPRIKLRQARPVFDALAGVMRKALSEGEGKPDTKFRLFAYPIGPTGVRVESMEDVICYGVVMMDQSEDFYWTTISRPQPVPGGYVAFGLSGERKVTIEDLSELQVDVLDLVKSVKQTSMSLLQFYAAMDPKTAPNMPAASA
jgi:hypothetical protein